MFFNVCLDLVLYGEIYDVYYLLGKFKWIKSNKLRYIYDY